MERLPQSVDGGIQRLLAEGYAVYRRGAYIVASVPYLDANGKPHTGLMVDTLNFDADGRVQATPSNHQMYFIGGQPFDEKGRQLFGGAGANSTALFDGKSSSFYWSWKQKDRAGNVREYETLYEKFVHYIDYVSGPAQQKCPEFKITPFLTGEMRPDCPFRFEDMNSARAALQELDRLIENDTIVIVGAGGTGSYIFDLISKTRVKEIRLYDADIFEIHNAFRVPGASVREEFGQPKVDVIRERYRGWHRGIQTVEAALDETSAARFDGATFAFVAVDKMHARRSVAKLLVSAGIPFIVVGMGIHHGQPGLTGIVETTLVDKETAPHVFNEVAGDQLADLDDEYHRNIQTVELNAMNAAVAVYMYKRYRGYYAAGRRVYRSLFTTASMQVDRDSLDD